MEYINMETMLTSKKSIFQTIIDFIFTVNFITIGMLIVSIARSIETQTLYADAYPEHLQGFSRIAASWFMAVAFEVTATVVTVNEKHDKYKTKTIIFAIASVIMTALFLAGGNEPMGFSPQVTGEVNYKHLITQVFLSAVSGYMVYVFAELFTDKAKAERIEIDTQLLLAEAQNELSILKNKLTQADQQLNLGEGKLSEAHQQLTLLESKLSERDLDVSLGEEKLTEAQLKVTLLENKLSERDLDVSLGEVKLSEAHLKVTSLEEELTEYHQKVQELEQELEERKLKASRAKRDALTIPFAKTGS